MTTTTGQTSTPWAGRLGARAVLLAALVGVLAVWVLGAFWSLEEQTRAAQSEGFTHPLILPFMLDGFAFTLAALALGASFDGRAALMARLGALAALAASAYINARGVYIRFDYEPTSDAVVMAVIAPVAAYLAFEVLLSSIRRQVQRWRGQAAPVPVPMPRPIRLLLSPWRTFTEWRREVLTLTASGTGMSPATSEVVANSVDSPGQATQTGQSASAEVAEVVHNDDSESTPEPAYELPKDAGTSVVGIHPVGDHPIAESESRPSDDAEADPSTEPVPARTRRRRHGDVKRQVVAALGVANNNVATALDLLKDQGVTADPSYVYKVRRGLAA